MKVTVLLVICLVGCAFAQLTPLATCSDNECVKAGEVCGFSALNVSIGCGADSRCTFSGGVTSTPNTGICRAPLKLGDYCRDSVSLGTCESGTICVADRDDNFICAVTNPISGSKYYPGEKCNYNVQCNYNSPFSGSLGTRDSENLCSNGKCKHIKNGDYCNGNNQCDYTSSYCGRTNVCEKYIKEGSACFFNDDSAGGCGPSGGNRICIPNGQEGSAGTCRKTYSQKEDQFCGDFSHCQVGMTCNKNTGAGSSNNGVCFKPMKTNTLNQPCPNATVDDTVNNNNGCNRTNLETCTCTQDGTYLCLASVNQNRDKDAWKQAECIRKHYCDGVGDLTCIKKHCKSITCDLYKRGRKHNLAAKRTCYYEGLCNSAFTLVASPILALIAFVVLALQGN